MDGGRPKHKLCAFWGARTRENTIINRVRSIPRATPAEPVRNPCGTPAEPSAEPLRNPCGTPAEPLRNPCGTRCGTHAEPMRNPRGTTCGSRVRSPLAWNFWMALSCTQVVGLGGAFAFFASEMHMSSGVPPPRAARPVFSAVFFFRCWRVLANQARRRVGGFVANSPSLLQMHIVA